MAEVCSSNITVTWQILLVLINIVDVLTIENMKTFHCKEGWGPHDSTSKTPNGWYARRGRQISVLWTWVFFNLLCGAIGTVATPGLLCQPQVTVKMIMQKQMECRLAGETEVLGENLPQRHFYPSQNPTWPDLGLNLGHCGGKPATNRLSYGAACGQGLW
jgi:hypothetical protein